MFFVQKYEISLTNNFMIWRNLRGLYAGYSKKIVWHGQRFSESASNSNLDQYVLRTENCFAKFSLF